MYQPSFLLIVLTIKKARDAQSQASPAPQLDRSLGNDAENGWVETVSAEVVSLVS